MSTPVEQIKERLSIEDVVGSYVKLERAGKSLKAKCPFHNEKTASFYVSPDRGGYYCFGCGAKGDIFSFIEQFEGLDFMGALKLLAERAGVDISRRPDGSGGFYGADYAKSKSEKDRLYAAMEDAAVFFEENLSGKNPAVEGNTSYAMAAADAREYIQKRGLTEKTVREFRIGFVPNEWRLLYQRLRDKGFSDAEIEKAGLAKRPEAAEGVKSLYDRFRDRVMFPIFDSSGRVIAFSGRILHEGLKNASNNLNGQNNPKSGVAAAKYLNSPDTPLYTKSTVLYGIDKAKQAIRERGYTILVEGQMDLVLSHQAGIKNTVAVSGTALADTLTSVSRDVSPHASATASGAVSPTTSKEGAVNNLGIVRRLSPNLILAFDSDAAGRKAAMRSARIALDLGMDVKIADLPEGRDPADLVLADPESWKNVLRAAKPVIEFQIDRVLADAAEKKLDRRKIPALLRETVYPFIATLPSRTDQAHYVKMVRERVLGNAENEAVIWEDVNKIKRVGENHVLTKNAPSAGSGQPPGSHATMLPNAGLSHLDVISRELFGLLAYLAAEHILDAEGYYASVRKIAGDTRYNNLIQATQTSKDELAFTAELFFGSADDIRKDEKKIQRKLDETVLNFEEEIVRSDIAAAMGKLASNKHDEALNNEIQALIMRKTDIDARRKGL